MLQRNSYSLLSITLFCKVLRYNSSKDLIVCWSFSYCFIYLINLFIFILCITLLPNDRVQAIPADVGKMIRPTPITERVIEVAFAPIMIIVSTDSIIVFEVL